MVGPGHPQRRPTETLVEDRFHMAFGARLGGHYDQIAALEGPNGAIRAAAGVRFAECEPLFLEQYLDEPVEQALALSLGRPVARDSVVEIGALAADGPEASLLFFGELAGWLAAACGRRYAVATARPELRRLLERAGFGLQVLADADPARLPSGAAGWGSYYAARPQVCAGEIGLGDICVAEALATLRARAAERALRRGPRSKP